MRINHILFVIPVLFMTFLLSSCFLDGKGRAGPRPSAPFGDQQVIDNAWRADAFPALACPADNISLKWDVGDPLCGGTEPECQTLSVTDSEGLLDPPFTSRQLTGTHVNGSVSDLDGWSGVGPIFTFSVAPDSPSALGWNDRLSQVLIVQNPPATAAEVTFSATSVCDPVSNRWSLVDFRLDMDSQSFIDSTRGLGSCVRITSVCYDGTGSVRYDPVVVSLVGGGMASATLSPGGCIDGISLLPNLHYQVAPDPSVPIIDRMGGSCVEGMPTDPITEQPSIELRFSLRCDTELTECGNE